MDIERIKDSLRKFSEDRNWDQFHSPKNLSMALAGEAGELLDVFQWLKEDESTIEQILPKSLEQAKEEIADIFLYLIRLADKLNIDLEQVAIDKIAKNEVKYPVELAKGNALKYNRRDA